MEFKSLRRFQNRHRIASDDEYNKPYIKKNYVNISMFQHRQPNIHTKIHVVNCLESYIMSCPNEAVPLLRLSINTIDVIALTIRSKCAQYVSRQDKIILQDVIGVPVKTNLESSAPVRCSHRTLHLPIMIFSVV